MRPDVEESDKYCRKESEKYSTLKKKIGRDGSF
jgi:hypothetical protein